jgi:hypothetical protein
MGKIQRCLILLLLVLGSSLIQAQEKPLTFQEVDRHSFELYEKGEWKTLKSFIKQALGEGYDYYYLRMRAGIACFETKSYLLAASHFEQALTFNTNDHVAGEYLYYCYLELNRAADAIRVYKGLTASVQEKLSNSLPALRQADLEAGPLFSNQMQVFDTIDLDGEDNIYGETDITQDGYYFSGGLSWGFEKGSSVYGGYSLIKLNKNKLAKIGDSLSVDDQYPLVQHQFYINGNIMLGKGFSLLPAFNFIHNRFETVMPHLAEDSMSYLFPVQTFRQNAFIGYLSITRDFRIVQTSLFFAFSNLNNEDQFQGGFHLLAFPLGNLDLYLSTKLINHRNAGQNRLIFEQMLGARLFKPLWAELFATFGQMENYHESNAFVVYNITGKMNFKGGAKLIYAFTPNCIISAEYLYLLREGEYINYTLDLQEDNQAIPVTMMKDFWNQIFLLGLKLKF